MKLHPSMRDSNAPRRRGGGGLGAHPPAPKPPHRRTCRDWSLE